MKYFVRFILVCIVCLGLAAPAQSTQISWVDWQSWPDSGNTALGQLQDATTTVDVTVFSDSGYNRVQTGPAEAFFWTGDAYTKGNVDNPPPSPDIVRLDAGGTVTINFSQAVVNPYLALVSWNGTNVRFDAPIILDSFGTGFFGFGTPQLNSTGDGFFGDGEVHGVVQVPGIFTEISFTHTTETWHGFTLGVEGVAPAVIPLPASLVLLSMGLAGGLLGRLRRS